MYGLVDCDNCFVSCERVFRPDLEKHPVVVLSNNDGCVISRSNEAKNIGIRMGMPYYQMREQYTEKEVTAFSSNYELYGDMSSRIMNILREEAPVVMQYSIDEAFLDIHGMENINLKDWGEKLSSKILKFVGMPVSIGIAKTKTLAKVASEFAKKYQGYNKCCYIDTDEKLEKALKIFPIKDVWGIGRRNRVKMEYFGIHTAYDFTLKSKSWVLKNFSITGVHTWLELKGYDCISLDTIDSKRKSLCTSRSFPSMIENFDDIRTHISNFAARCAEKLRLQHSVAGMVTVFIDTNHLRYDLPQYGNGKSKILHTPSNATQTIITACISVLLNIYKDGYKYKRGGVVVSDICDEFAVQTDFTDYDADNYRKINTLMSTIDNINRQNGMDMVVLGAQQYKEKSEDGKRLKFCNAVRRALKSPNYNEPYKFIVKSK